MGDSLDRVAADLRHAASAAGPKAEAVVAHGCLNIKQDWRAAWSHLGHAPLLPLSIDYTPEYLPAIGVLRGEVGPDKDKPQGALGNLLEYGSVHNAPHPAGHAALERETPRFFAALDQVIMADLWDR